MRKIIRVLFLLSPIIILGFAYYGYKTWHPPLNPAMPQPVEIETLLEHIDTYKAPMLLIISGSVLNKSEAEKMIFLAGDVPFRINCSTLEIGAVENGMTLYLRGYSYYHEEEKQYFLAIDLHIQVSYSMYLSIPIAILILFILFIGFKFKLNDFSFSRRMEEKREDA